MPANALWRFQNVPTLGELSNILPTVSSPLEKGSVSLSLSYNSILLDVEFNPSTNFFQRTEGSLRRFQIELIREVTKTPRTEMK